MVDLLMEYKVEVIKTIQSFWGEVTVPQAEINQTIANYVKDCWEVFSIVPLTQAYGATSQLLITFVKK